MLGVIAALYASGHETFVGSIDGPSPELAPGLAQNMVWAIIVYAVRPPLVIYLYRSSPFFLVSLEVLRQRSLRGMGCSKTPKGGLSRAIL